MTQLAQRPLLEDPARADGAWWRASGRQDWNTPAVVLHVVRQLGPIALDPCSNPASIVEAAESWSLEAGDNGLARPWRGRGLVFVNPPYGKGEIEKFTAKAAGEFGGNCLGDELVMLVPANTDTRWFHRDIAPAAAALCFWKGRITFLGAPSGAGFGSLVVYFGSDPARFRAVFSPVGWVP